MPRRRYNRRAGVILVIAFVFAILVFSLSIKVEAFLGPSTGQTPGSGGGAMTVDSNRNIGFNTYNVVNTSTHATPPWADSTGFSRVFMIAATSSPPGIGLRNIGTDCPSGGCDGYTLSPATYVWRLTPWGWMELFNATDESYGARRMFIMQNGNVGIGVYPTTVPEKFMVQGNIRADIYYSSSSPAGFVGILNAANVTGPAAFGSNYGTYNFAFPGAVAIGTSTTAGLPTNGLYVSGNVGIGTTSPQSELNVASTNETYLDIIADSDANGADNDALLRFFIDGVSGTGTQKGKIGYDQGLDRFVLGYGADNDLMLDTSGNVGIGTTAPTKKLDVNGSLNLSPSTGAIGGYYLFTDSEDSTTKFRQYLVNTGKWSFEDWSGSVWQSRLSIINGNVGIGTTTPGYALDVYAGGGRFTGPVIVGTPTDDSHATTKSYVDSVVTGGSGSGSFNTISVANTSTFATTGGNVGIGTTNPGEKLEITGNARISGHYKFTGAGTHYFKTEGGTASTDKFIFRFSDDQDVMTIAGDGNVGIGTTAPVTGLQLSYSDASTTSPVNGLTLLNYVGAANVFVGMKLSTYGATDGGNYPKQFIGAIRNPSGSGLGDIVFLNRNAVDASVVSASDERMRITYTGNVGIATTSPAYNLDVYGTGRITQPLFVGTPTASGHAATKSYVDSAVATATSTQYWTASSTSIYYNSGNVGIGTANPGRKLTVLTDTQFDGIDLRDTTYSSLAKLGNYGSGEGYLLLSNAGSVNVQVRSNGSSYFNGGNVGIGTSTLQAKLHIYGDGATNMLAMTANYGTPQVWTQYVDSGGWYMKQDSNFVFHIHSGGNVGIATTSPAYNLDVYGTGRITQPFFVGSPTADGHAATKSYVDSAVTGGGGAGAFTTLSSSATTTLATSGGNVGIGTTGPSQKLEVIGNIKLNSAGTSGWIDFSESGTNRGYVGYGDNNAIFTGASSDSLSIRATGDMFLGSGGNNIRMTLLSGGNVGIATTSPAYNLDVYGTARITQPLFVGSPTSDGHAATKSYVDSAVATATSTQYWTATSTGIFYTSGSIGVGTANPGTKLDVSGGNLRVTGYGAPASGAGLEFGYQSNSGYIYAYDRAASQYKGVDINDIFYITGGSATGNVGIATTSPAYNLDVYGTGRFVQPLLIGSPTADGHATTRSYVDSALTSYLLLSGGTMAGNLNLNGNNILGVNKLTVTTLDPLYNISGEKYATYGASIAGGVKEEIVGKLTLNKKYKTSDKYIAVIDFDSVQKGSDLWVWRKIIDFSKDNIEVLATSYGIPVPIAYEINGNKIIFNSNLSDATYEIPKDGIEFSYRLIGKRFDWREHPTYAKDQNEKAGLTVK